MSHTQKAAVLLEQARLELRLAYATFEGDAARFFELRDFGDNVNDLRNAIDTWRTANEEAVNPPGLALPVILHHALTVRDDIPGIRTATLWTMCGESVPDVSVAITGEITCVPCLRLIFKGRKLRDFVSRTPCQAPSMADRMTTDERRAIAALKRLAKTWPRSLWLFAANGNLHVMQTNEAGARVIGPDGGYDSARSLLTVTISCDGGDW